MPITLTMKDASRESGLSVRMLYTLIGQKRLASTRIGRRRLVIAASLMKLLTGGDGLEKKSRGNGHPARESDGAGQQKLKRPRAVSG